MLTETIGMGFAIYVTDMILRPSFNYGMMETLLFIIQGAVAFWVYHVISGYENNSSSPTSITMDLFELFVGSAIGGLVLYLTNGILRMYFMTGVANEIIKFMIQGGILWFTYSTFVGATNRLW